MNNQNSPKTFILFRKTAYLEGWSYLILLFIAMPLKYFFDFPLAVRIAGLAHGLLFIILGILALLVLFQYQRSYLWLLKAFVASIIPFGTFYQDQIWKLEQKEIS